MPTPLPASRYYFIDALRGLAAVWVAGYHFYGGLSASGTRAVFREPFHSLLTAGNCGVEIFFVLSGFVIAYSVREARLSGGYVANFILRRAVRLDPPYWATILLAIAVLCLSNLVRNDRVAALPTLPQLAAHAFYVQGVLGYGHIVEVFWTLCLEVQFYLAFLLVLGLIQRFAERFRLSATSRQSAVLVLLLPLAGLSLAVQTQLLAPPLRGFMLKFWYLFQLGVFAWWALSGVLRNVHFAGYALLVGCACAMHFTRESAIGLGTGLLLFAVGKAGRLDRWLNVAPLQYLGRVSYSLYLVHPVVGVPFAYFIARRLAGPAPSPSAALLLFGAAFAASLGAAHLLHRFVEVPSQELSRRLKSVKFLPLLLPRRRTA